MARIWVKGYTKADGTKVPGHYRQPTRKANAKALSDEYNRVGGKLRKMVDKGMHNPYYDTNKPGKVLRSASFVRYKKKMTRITRRLKAMGAY